MIDQDTLQQHALLVEHGADRSGSLSHIEAARERLEVLPHAVPCVDGAPANPQSGTTTLPAAM